MTNLRRKAGAKGSHAPQLIECDTVPKEKVLRTASACLPEVRCSSHWRAIWPVWCASRSRKSLMRFLRRAIARAYESVSPTRRLQPRDRSSLIKCGALLFVIACFTGTFVCLATVSAIVDDSVHQASVTSEVPRAVEKNSNRLVFPLRCSVHRGWHVFNRSFPSGASNGGR